MKPESAGRSLGERLVGFARWLAARERLPQPPPPRSRVARGHWLMALLRPEELPPAPQSPTGGGKRRLNLGWLLAREPLPEPLPKSSETRARGVLRRLLSPERLPEPAAAAKSEGEEHDQRR